MDLNLIKKPVITEKSTTNAQFNKYIFEVRDAYSDGMYGDQQTFIKVFDANDQLITAV